MNNLTFFRELSGVTVKQLSSILAVTVYTYKAYEQERMVLRDEISLMLTKLYQISYEELFCSKLKISTESIKKVKSLSNLSDEERYKAMIYNLTGEHMKALSFNKICEIKKALEFDKSPNENNED